MPNVEDSIDLGKKVRKKLYEGMIIKNKQELFRILGLIKNNTILRGIQKQNLENELSIYCKYEKYKGNQIIISKIYQEPDITKINETKKKNIYMKHIESLLLDYISKYPKDIVCIDISYSGLFTLLGMNNDYYRNIRKYINVLTENDCRITHWEIENFIIRSYSIMKTIVNRTLKKLEDKSLIRASDEVMIFDGKQSHMASNEEISKILTVESDVREGMGYKDKSDLFLRSKIDIFYDKVKNILKEKYGWENYFSCIHIIKGSNTSIIKALTKSKAELHKMALNENVISSVNRDADNRYNNQNLRLEEEWNNRTEDSPGLYPTFEIFKDLKVHYPDTYTEVQHKLSDYFLSINPSDYQELAKMIKEYNQKKQEELRKKKLSKNS